MDIVGFLRDPESWRDMRSNARQLAQSASNAIAGNLTGPVDLINLGLGAIGLPVSQRPVGGSEWARRAGLTPDVPQGAPRVAGETLGLLGPVVAAKYAPQIAEGLLAAGDAMPGMSKGGRYFVNQDGKIVWHGSPHKFDKFDSSKIGTGEGLQAYGQGLYTAEQKKTAQSYRAINREGKQFGLDDGPAKGIANMIAIRGDEGEKLAREAYKDLGDKLEPTIDAAKKAINETSYLYKVDLADDAIPKMLDWDSPVAEPLRKQVTSAAMQRFGSGSTGTSGQNLYEELAKEFKWQGSKNPSADAAEFLRQQGIPGIRYLDGKSRAAGEGSYNYVVFPGNENLLKILERNGVPVGGLLD